MPISFNQKKCFGFGSFEYVLMGPRSNSKCRAGAIREAFKVNTDEQMGCCSRRSLLLHGPGDAPVSQF